MDNIQIVYNQFVTVDQPFIFYSIIILLVILTSLAFILAYKEIKKDNK